jgi:hypothetical protein
MLLALCAQLAGAQGPGAVRRGAILGSVVDTALAPLADVNVEVVGAGAKVQTDVGGRFVINDVPPGDFLFYVRKLGVKPVTNLLHVEAGDTLRIAFTMEPVVTALGTVNITEAVRSPKMREFDDRRRGGVGQFLDEGQIAKLNFPDLIGVVRTFQSVRVTEAGAVMSRRTPPPPSTQCEMMVYLDGIPRGSSLADMPSPKDVAGIEVYAGPSTTPLWLAQGNKGGRGGEKWCGVVMVWSRDR